MTEKQTNKAAKITIENISGLDLDIPAKPTEQVIKAVTRAVADVLYQVYSSELSLLSTLPEETQNLAPFIEEELAAAQAAGDIKQNRFMLEVWQQGFEPDGTPIKESPFAEIIARAEAKRSAYTKKQAPRFAYIRRLKKRIADYDPDHKPEPKKTPRDLAVEQGALTTLHNKLAYPSTALYAKAFTPSAIKALPGKEGEGKYTIDENGQICLFAPMDFKEVTRIYGAFLAAMLQLALDTDDEDAPTLKFYAPQICRELGIDPREYSTKRGSDQANLSELRYAALYRCIEPFEGFAGEIDDVLYRLLLFESYDKNSEVMTVKAPYIFKLLEAITKQTALARHSQFNRLIYSTAASEANYAAVEVAAYLINKLLQRGATKAKASKPPYYSYTIRYSRLISECPQLKKELDAIDKAGANGTDTHATQNYNKKLRRTLEAAYRIILEKSDITAKFQDLKINNVSEWESTYRHEKGTRKRAADFRVPTKSKLTTNLTITHNGYIGDE